MEHSQGTWHRVSAQYSKSRKEREPDSLNRARQGPGGVGGTNILAGVLTDDPTIVFICPVTAV